MGGKPGTGADGWLIKTESGGGGYFVLSRRVARAMTTWDRRWGEIWVRSIKIPRFLAALGGGGILPKGPWHVPGIPLGVEFGFLASFFLHIHKKCTSLLIYLNYDLGGVRLFSPDTSSYRKSTDPDLVGLSDYKIEKQQRMPE